MRPSSLRLLAPAKINLHLRVGPRREDGFHPLLSWMCTVGLYDTLTIQANDAGRIELSCDRADLPCDQSNLVVKVAAALADEEAAHGAASPGVCAVLQKRIPMGAGLGGGSADGARMLQGLNRLWGLNRSPEQLAALAARLGSDLSFFFHAPSAICTGRGEIVRPIPAPAAKWALLILPALAMPTPAVYRRFDEMGLGEASAVTQEPDWERWTRLDARALLPLLVNDLEAPAFAISPQLGQLRRDIEQTLARPVRMSGSGSSLFTLFDEQQEAEQAARTAQDRHSTRARAIAVPLAPQIHDDLGQSDQAG